MTKMQSAQVFGEAEMYQAFPLDTETLKIAALTAGEPVKAIALTTGTKLVELVVVSTEPPATSRPTPVSVSTSNNANSAYFFPLHKGRLKYAIPTGVTKLTFSATGLTTGTVSVYLLECD